MSIAIPVCAARDDGRPKIFILSDVRLYRDGLVWSLSRPGDFTIVGAAAPGSVVLSMLVEAKVSVLLLDASMPIGLDIVKELRRIAPDIKVVVFAIGETDDELIAYAEAGVCGYVTRDGSIEMLIEAVRRALREELACSLHVGALLFRRLANLSRAEQPSERAALTRREQEIMRLVDQGYSNKDIARTLHIGLATVKNHVHNILDKLNVHRRGEAAARLRAPGTKSLRC